MADTNPARALEVVEHLAEMCDVLEHPEVVVVTEQKMVPWPRTVTASLDLPVWVGLGTVGLWAALDAFAERADLKRPRCPICNRRSCIWTRFANHTRGAESQSLKELEDLRHLYAHNYAGDADDRYFDPHHPRHVLKSGVHIRLSCGAQFDGRQPWLDLTHLRGYARTVQSVLERFSKP
jgi:hypothetical protein